MVFLTFLRWGQIQERRQKTIAVDNILHGPGRRERLVITETHNTLSLGICTWKNNEIIMDKYDAKCVYGAACFINLEHYRDKTPPANFKISMNCGN